MANNIGFLDRAATEFMPSVLSIPLKFTKFFTAFCKDLCQPDASTLLAVNVDGTRDLTNQKVGLIMAL